MYEKPMKIEGIKILRGREKILGENGNKKNRIFYKVFTVTSWPYGDYHERLDGLFTAESVNGHYVLIAKTFDGELIFDVRHTLIESDNMLFEKASECFNGLDRKIIKM